MPLIASSKSGSEIEPVPAGLHAGICCGVFDIGTQHSEMYNKDSRQVVLQFELPELPRLDVGPRVLSTRRMTVSLNEKAKLRAFLETWRGRKFTETELAGFDLRKLLGVPSLLQVMHEESDGKTYANISACLSAPKSQVIKGSIVPTLLIVDELDAPKLPPNIPEWVGELVMKSKEWQRLVARPRATEPASEPEDDFTAATPAEEDPFA